MRNVKLNGDNPLDPHEQVAAEIRRAITDGDPEESALIEHTKELLHYARTHGYKQSREVFDDVDEFVG